MCVCVAVVWVGRGLGWVGGLDQGLEVWCYVCVRCESGLSV